ncbi:MAG: hypothetical protein QG641_2008 [Candidatus Poribacteria bacterium]|nr:hypothetical protein [Candidatus Poribacteria bacterium]
MNNEGCDIVDKIRINFKKAEIKKCSEAGCNLRLDNLGSFIALKGEIIIKNPCFNDLVSNLVKKPGDNPRICDYIIIKANGDIIVGLIELKSHKPSASIIKEQLENGSKIALELLKNLMFTFSKHNFFPIVLAQSWNATVFRKLSDSYVMDTRIIPKKCGDSFVEIIHKEKQKRERELQSKKQKKRR